MPVLEISIRVHHTHVCRYEPRRSCNQSIIAVIEISLVTKIDTWEPRLFAISRIAK